MATLEATATQLISSDAGTTQALRLQPQNRLLVARALPCPSKRYVSLRHLANVRFCRWPYSAVRIPAAKVLTGGLGVA